MIFGENEKKAFKQATECHICEKPLEDDVNGRMDHLTNIQHWLEILNLDLRKIPIEKEMEKAMNEFDGIKYTDTTRKITFFFFTGMENNWNFNWIEYQNTKK